jgi:hypothetical protein
MRAKKVKMYMIRATPNVMGNRRSYGRFRKKSTALKELKKILKNRDNMSGVGFNNPRIKKFRGYK